MSALAQRWNQGADPQEAFSKGLKALSHFIFSPGESFPWGTQKPEKDNFVVPYCFQYRSTHNL